MTRTRAAFAVVCIGLTVWFGSVSGGAAFAQTAPGAAPASAASNAGTAQSGAAAPPRKTCAIDNAAPNAAETALNSGNYKVAENLFRATLSASPGSEAAHEELIRTMLEQDRVADAVKDAEAWNAAGPADSMAMTALADVRLRQGIPLEAFSLYRKAIRADLCNARAYYGFAKLEELVGYFATAKSMVAQAYVLHPTDDDIETAWFSTLPREERMARWTDYAEHSTQISEDNRAKLKTHLAKESLYHASDCRMAPSSPREATVPMVKLMDGPYNFAGWGVDVQFNGKRRRLQIDTGASGITISRQAAMFLGIQREDTAHMGGIGDDAEVKTSVAHVANIRIGGIEFTNCPVEILDKWDVLENQGLIGGDVFRGSLLTLDFPKQEMRVASLPPRPGDTPADDDDDAAPHDAYRAPGMEKWLRIFRSGHDLLIPTELVATKKIHDPSAWKDRIFLLDTGSYSNLISPAAARDVTKVSRDDSVGVQGIQGEVKKVYAADEFTLAFAGLRLNAESMTSIDMTSISHGAGMEISGLIGEPTLSQLVMHIDYRDNLVLCEYTPAK